MTVGEALRAGGRFRLPAGAHGPRALLGLVLLVLAIFPEAWLTRRGFFERDILAYWYPLVESFVRVVHEGAWPLWNPWVTFGTPMLADPNLQVAYPLTWLNLVLPPAAYYKVFVLVHCVGGGFGAWLLARRRGLRPLPSFLAAAGYTASGPLLSSVSLFHHFASAAWTPWVLWALDRALRGPTATSVLLLGTVAAAQLLAGSADVAFMTALLASGAVAAFVLLGTRDAEAPDSAPRRLRVVALVVPVAVAFAAVLAAVQWWPTMARVADGTRLSLDPRTSLHWSLHPASLAELLVPGLVAGLPVGPAARQTLFEGREPLLESVYLGLPCLALAGLAVLSSRRRSTLLLAAGFVVFLVAALGRHAPLLPALLELPPFGLFRFPPKYLLPTSLLFALLAGVGLEAFARAEGGRDRRGVLAVGVVGLALSALIAALAVGLGVRPSTIAPILAEEADLEAAARAVCVRLWTAGGTALATAVLFLSRWRLAGPRPGLTIALLGLAVLDLAAAGRPVNSFAPPELLRHRPAVVEAMLARDEAPRVHVVSDPGEWLREQRERGAVGGPPQWGAALGILDRLRPPAGARFGVGGSYDGSFTGMEPPALSLLSLAAWRARESPALVRLLRLGSVDYVVAVHDLPLPGLREVGRFASVYAEPVRLLRVEHPLPRAYLVDRVRAASGSDAMGALLDPGFDPTRDVVLAREDPEHHPAPDFRGTARIASRSSDRIDVLTEAESPGYLVVTETFDRGWQVRVDDEPGELRTGNLLFCAVRVPEGRHRVELVYRPDAVRWGAVASALALAFGLAAWGVGRRRRQRVRESAAATLT